MELFRLDASGVGHLDALGNESVRFAGVLLNGVRGYFVGRTKSNCMAPER